MGVPGFFRWLVQRYPLIRRNANDPSHPRVHNLFIDFNGILYSALKFTRFNGTEVTEDYIAEVRRYVDMLVQLIRPTDLIFVAVDGPAPASKMCQQRSRRFVSARDASPGSFDRTVLSPGTQFMSDINDSLVAFIGHKKKTDSAWKTPNVIYSSSFVPGEGEHKILDYIRLNRARPEWNPNQVHVMFSNDADSIFLALQTHEPFFMILREGDASAWERPRQAFEGRETVMKWSSKSFEYLHVALIREYMSKDFGADGEILERVIDDYVGIAFLMGNDFIPEFDDIVIQRGGFNLVIDAYRSARESMPGFLVENAAFVRPFLRLFLEKVVSNFIESYDKKKLKTTSANLIDARTEFFKAHLLSKHKGVTPELLPRLIERMSHSILDAFSWTLKYYTSGCPSWTWYYPFHYSPPLFFVPPFIEGYELIFELGEPFLRFLQ
jgi:5'-3' exoribonuclease 1